MLGGDFKDFSWVHEFDWDNLGKFWKDGGEALQGMTINPMSAIIEKIGSMNNCTV